MLVGITGKHEWGSAELPERLRPSMPANLFYENYASGVLAAGMTPVFLPLSSEADRIAVHLDGLVIAGGADIDPRLYGRTPVPSSTAIDPRRDAVETALMAAMSDRGKPVLGVCRGHQLINVVHGGTLVMDLPSGQGESHAHFGYPTHHRSHHVSVDPESSLSALTGSDVMVNSFHHQAVEQVAPGFSAIAWADDGVIEGIESKDRQILGVQWHPEMFREQPDPAFQWLAKAIEESHSKRRNCGDD